MKTYKEINFEQVRDILYELYKNNELTIIEFYNLLIETRKQLKLPYIDVTGDFYG